MQLTINKFQVFKVSGQQASAMGAYYNTNHVPNLSSPLNNELQLLEPIASSIRQCAAVGYFGPIIIVLSFKTFNELSFLKDILDLIVKRYPSIKFRFFVEIPPDLATAGAMEFYSLNLPSVSWLIKLQNLRDINFNLIGRSTIGGICVDYDLLKRAEFNFRHKLFVKYFLFAVKNSGMKLLINNLLSPEQFSHATEFRCDYFVNNASGLNPV